MTEQEFWDILRAVPETKPIFYRLYHNDNGTPIVYSMEELPGKYIEVDQETYALASYNVKVINGELSEIIPKTYIRKLVPSKGTPCNTNDVTIVVDYEQPHTKWSIKEYETS